MNFNLFGRKYLSRGGIEQMRCDLSIKKRMRIYSTYVTSSLFLKSHYHSLFVNLYAILIYIRLQVVRCPTLRNISPKNKIKAKDTKSVLYACIPISYTLLIQKNIQHDYVTILLLRMKKNYLVLNYVQ